jgi:hypothetical protein
MFTHVLAAGALAASPLVIPAGTPPQSPQRFPVHAPPGERRTDQIDRLVGTWQRASPGQSFLYQWKFSRDGKYVWKFGTIVAPGANSGSPPRTDEVETGTFKVRDGRIELTPRTCRTEVKNRSLPHGGYARNLDPAPARAYSWSIRTGENGQQILTLADTGTAPSGSCLPARHKTALGYDYGDSGRFASVD